MEPNRKRLREIMRDHELKATDVGRMLNRSPVTVRQWRAGIYATPRHMVELLELKLAARLRGPAA